jgi:hypothetical protein
MELPTEPPRYFSLNAGALDPGDAMLAAKARVQASSAAFSGEAKERQGESAAIEAAPRMRVRMIMMVFLLEKIPTPRSDTSALRSAQQTRNSFNNARFISCIGGAPHARRTSRDPALAQNPAREFLQILARAILRPMQEVVTFVCGQFRLE